MWVAVVDIREMPVTVDHGRMAMNMDMGFAGWIQRAMNMPVVLVMHMAVLMRHRFVRVLMLMLLGEMEVDAEPHQHPGDRKLQRKGLAQQADRDERAEKWRHSVVSAGSRRANFPQCAHEENKADAIADEPDETARQQEAGSRQRRAPCQSETEIDDAGNKPLDAGDLDRIAGADLSRQIVVDAPGETGPRDQEIRPSQFRKPGRPRRE